MPIDGTLRSLALITGLAAMLAGCSEYTDRRDTISLNGGNAVATNIVTQTVDPWPAVSADKNIAFNGQKMQSAVQRYRNNQIIQPVGTGTSSSYSQQGSGAPPAAPDPAGSPPPAPKSP
jgi:PBP1b-binding outer membrane lipoprotein LpoB